MEQEDFYINLLKEENFERQLINLTRKHEGKKIVLYGAGMFFKIICQNYDLTGLNIVAISDKKYMDVETPSFDSELGYNVISPLFINSLKPDIVFLTVAEEFFIEKFFHEELFKDKTRKFKYKMLFQKSLARKIHEEFMKRV